MKGFGGGVKKGFERGFDTKLHLLMNLEYVTDLKLKGTVTFLFGALRFIRFYWIASNGYEIVKSVTYILWFPVAVVCPTVIYET